MRARARCVTLLGRNGAGKTTTLRVDHGPGAAKRKAAIRFDGKEMRGLAAAAGSRAHGIACVPEERGIFAMPRVAENMTLPPVIANDGMPLERIFEMFPNLVERRASRGSKFSGGEQQMLAIGRILRTGAQLPAARRADGRTCARHRAADPR